MCAGEVTRAVAQSSAALGEAFPGTIVTSLVSDDPQKPLGFSCVSVWGTGKRGTRILTVPSDAPAPELYRLNLFGEVQGIQQHVSSAWVRGGQGGLLFTVTGLQVDGWYLYAQALDARDSMKVAMLASSGCSALSIRVPAQFRTIQEDFRDGSPAWPLLPPSMTDAPFAPLETETGYYDVQTAAGGNAVVPVNVRVLRITFRAGADTTVQLISAQGPPRSIIVQAGLVSIMEPLGTLAGPCVFVVPAGVDWRLETVR